MVITISDIFGLIDRNCFSPVPQVDSAILHLIPRITSCVDIKSHQGFWKLVKTIFQTRRKTLKNSLKAMGMTGEMLNVLEREFDLMKRGETLSLAQLAELSNALLPR